MSHTHSFVLMHGLAVLRFYMLTYRLELSTKLK